MAKLLPKAGFDCTSVLAGPSGWSYPHWNGSVYPKPRPRDLDRLQWLADRVDAVEITSSFTRPIDSRTAERWARSVEGNPDFRFSVRLARYFTHDRLSAATAITYFKEGLWPIRSAGRFGALYLDFPEGFRFNRQNSEFLLTLRAAFHEFPQAADLPHESWQSDEAMGVLKDHGIAMVNSSSLASSLGYLRISDVSPDLNAVIARVLRLAPFAERMFVIFTDDIQGRSFENSIKVRAALVGRMVQPAQPLLGFDHHA